jgi:hypothetical protein
MHGEHETKRYAPGPEPIFSAVTQNRPPPGTACREDTACVRHASRNHREIRRGSRGTALFLVVAESNRGSGFSLRLFAGARTRQCGFDHRAFALGFGA